MTITAAKYGPWAVIPGGSEAIGAAFAHKLGKAGINVVLIARKEGPLEEVARAVRAESGVQVRTLALDLTRPDLLECVRKITDDIDVGLLVYNAGAQQSTAPFVEKTLEDAMKVVLLNPVGQVALCHHFGKKMAARGRGGIILMGSLAGSAGGATVVTYSASKAFTHIFAEGLWSELKPRGVDVVSVVMGAVDTPSMTRLGVTFRPGEAADPNDMAQLSLDNIANGPIYVMPPIAEFFQQLCGMPRRQASETMTNMLTGVTH